jgi:pimeloyl-ACP methyl ester carboxylesterase
MATFVEEVAAVREALGLDRVHLLGHSWGTQVALELGYTVRVWDMGTRVNPRVIRLGVPVHSVTKPKNGVVVAAYPTGLTALRF